ncbi:2-C-methyl-D-erythritol 4-phosphate cytidylyltransferase [Teredinibacter sp. KSP-S5-2]|uniref:2-C-methyl-D-erythritol 4-phosphate cytidylyltransferase n=1 Tax=Teredinibacter sp. KSP-S5-2 TaxID=3034506 RepID=UPI002934A811|nr:2-C-methyl-D-erythritol 4-phosphate cytidylyltransferase [Teredinibacter sp. KSP-S5-2]WNO10350.1 2-C-methyl-D-erythritol 4-phosphate cytidylyltransferase [Teredinibacter sp. KSP-S5-2]
MPQDSIIIWAVVPAAGVGKRMASDVPKQYLTLAGHTVLDTTLQKLFGLDAVSNIVVAVSDEDEYWPDSQFASHPDIYRVSGGKERSDSVLSALRYIANHVEDMSSTWVLVHDAARPCFSPVKVNELIATCTMNNMGGILAAPVADTVKRAPETGDKIIEIEKTEDRDQLWLAHTPQFFPLGALHSALEACLQQGLPVTDEASAIEAVGGRSLIVADRRDNIKITVPEDLYWAQHILKQHII